MNSIKLTEFLRLTKSGNISKTIKKENKWLSINCAEKDYVACAKKVIAMISMFTDVIKSKINCELVALRVNCEAVLDGFQFSLNIMSIETGNSMGYIIAYTNNRKSSIDLYRVQDYWKCLKCSQGNVLLENDSWANVINDFKLKIS